jgi:hypothetical protein
MSELRRAERSRVFLKAHIYFNGNLSSVECRLQNLSVSGAKIVVAANIPLPDEFDLDIPLKSQRHHAKLVWRKADSAGVTFAAEPEHRADDGDADLRALEIQNRKLKAALKDLTKQLEDVGQDVSLLLPEGRF